MAKNDRIVVDADGLVIVSESDAMLDNGKKPAKPTSVADSMALYEEQRALKMAADRERSELELAKSKGELVTIADVRARLSREITVARTLLMSLGDGVCGRLASIDSERDIKALIDARVIEILDDVADKLGAE
jgi:hypothetical protein